MNYQLAIINGDTDEILYHYDVPSDILTHLVSNDVEPEVLLVGWNYKDGTLRSSNTPKELMADSVGGSDAGLLGLVFKPVSIMDGDMLDKYFSYYDIYRERKIARDGAAKVLLQIMIELLSTKQNGTIKKITDKGVYVIFGKSTVYINFCETFTRSGLTELIDNDMMTSKDTSNDQP